MGLASCLEEDCEDNQSCWDCQETGKQPVLSLASHKGHRLRCGGGPLIRIHRDWAGKSVLDPGYPETRGWAWGGRVDGDSKGGRLS